MFSRMIVLVVLTVALAFQASAATLSEAQVTDAVQIMGEYSGYRDSKLSEQLAQYERQAFDLFHQGKAAEAEKLRNEKIAPLRTKLESMPKCTLFMRAETHGTARGNFTMHLLINPVSASEEKTGGAYTNSVWFDLSFDQFAQFFTADTEVKGVEVGKGNVRYQTWVTTKISGRNRKVIVNQQFKESGKLDEDHYIYFELEDNVLTSIKIVRNRRRAVAGIGFGGLRTFMKAEITGLQKTVPGLQLGRAGRVSTAKYIQKALMAEKESEYATIIREERVFLNR